MLLFFSCQGEGKTGFIQGQISNAGGKTLFLDELTSQSINPKDSIKLDDSGKFSFNPDIKEPGFFRVRIDQNNFALIFLEPGQPLKITADAANLGKTYQIQENEENRKLSEATKFLIKNGERGDSLNQVANSNPNLMSDTLLLKKLQSRFEEIKNNEILYIKKYVKDIRENMNKEVLALGYYDQNELPPMRFAKLGLDFFTKKNLNWHFKPITPIVKNFVNKEFDMLIDLHTGNSLPFRYVVAMSKAKFKIGKYDSKVARFYDFMISTEEHIALPQFIEQVNHYLKKITHE
jgi:hypothetical protein